jgi:hypothetical protein
MIEDRLVEILDRVAVGGPDEAGAFDRFLRRRARHTRRVVAATALTLVAVLAGAVALPRLGQDPDRRPRLYATGAVGPERWQSGPLVAVAPLQGFEVDVPAGWEVDPTWKGFELRPASPELRRRLAGPVQLSTTFLEQFYNPAPNVWKDGTYDEGEDRDLPKAARPAPEGRQSRGDFPGDRSWFRTDGQDGRWRTTRWYISWPYRCEPGVRCPPPLALRTLRVAFQVEAAALAEVAGLAEGLLRSARPIGNAVKGQSHAPRPDCVDGRSMVILRGTGSSWPEGPNTPVITFWWRARTGANLVPCTIQGPLGVELVDASGRRLEVQGNGLALSPVANLPESRTIYEGPGRVELGLKWINWCGDGPTRLRWIGEPSSGRTVPIDPPRCTDSSKPSKLSVDHILR